MDGAGTTMIVEDEGKLVSSETKGEDSDAELDSTGV